MGGVTPPSPIFLDGVRLNQVHGRFTFMCNIISEDDAESTKRAIMNSNEMKEECCVNVAFEKRVENSIPCQTLQFCASRGITALAG